MNPFKTILAKIDGGMAVIEVDLSEFAPPKKPVLMIEITSMWSPVTIDSVEPASATDPVFHAEFSEDGKWLALSAASAYPISAGKIRVGFGGVQKADVELRLHLVDDSGGVATAAGPAAAAIPPFTHHRVPNTGSPAALSTGATMPPGGTTSLIDTVRRDAALSKVSERRRVVIGKAQDGVSLRLIKSYLFFLRIDIETSSYLADLRHPRLEERLPDRSLVLKSCRRILDRRMGERINGIAPTLVVGEDDVLEKTSWLIANCALSVFGQFWQGETGSALVAFAGGWLRFDMANPQDGAPDHYVFLLLPELAIACGEAKVMGWFWKPLLRRLKLAQEVFVQTFRLPPQIPVKLMEVNPAYYPQGAFALANYAKSQGGRRLFTPSNQASDVELSASLSAIVRNPASS